MIQQTTRSTPRLDLGVAYHEYVPEDMVFVAELVLPTMNVAKEAGTISVITRENARATNNKHANGATFNRINRNAEDMSYTTTDYGLEGQLTDVDRENYMSDFDGEVETVQGIKTEMLLNKEIRAAAALFNTTTWTGASLYTDVSTDWDAAGADIIGDVRGAQEIVRKNTGRRPRSMLIGPETWLNMKTNTAILAKYIGIDVLTDDTWLRFVPGVLGLREIIVADGVYNNAKEGQTASMADIWSDDYALLFNRHAGPLSNSGLGRTLRWTGESGSLVNGLDTVVTYREEQTESDVYRVREYVGEKIFDPYQAHLLLIDT